VQPEANTLAANRRCGNRFLAFGAIDRVARIEEAAGSTRPARIGIEEIADADRKLDAPDAVAPSRLRRCAGRVSE
jgi:hypothetical protein